MDNLLVSDPDETLWQSVFVMHTHMVAADTNDGRQEPRIVIEERHWPESASDEALRRRAALIAHVNDDANEVIPPPLGAAAMAPPVQPVLQPHPLHGGVAAELKLPYVVAPPASPRHVMAAGEVDGVSAELRTDDVEHRFAVAASGPHSASEVAGGGEVQLAVVQALVSKLGGAGYVSDVSLDTSGLPIHQTLGEGDLAAGPDAAGRRLVPSKSRRNAVLLTAAGVPVGYVRDVVEGLVALTPSGLQSWYPQAMAAADAKAAIEFADRWGAVFAERGGSGLDRRALVDQLVLGYLDAAGLMHAWEGDERSESTVLVSRTAAGSLVANLPGTVHAFLDEHREAMVDDFKGRFAAGVENAELLAELPAEGQNGAAFEVAPSSWQPSPAGYLRGMLGGPNPPRLVGADEPLMAPPAGAVQGPGDGPQVMLQINYAGDRADVPSRELFFPEPPFREQFTNAAQVVDQAHQSARADAQR
ncbi:MAG: hypothetical protein ACRC0L_06570, partial [Angustibacter sp.]